MSTLQKSMRSTSNESGLTNVHKKGNLRLIPVLAGATVSETVNF